MSERLLPGLRRGLRWGLLGVAVVLIVVFLPAQRQSTEVSYGRETAEEEASAEEGSAGELSGARLPSVGEMEAMLARDPVVRLPGSIAWFDERRIAEAIRADVDGRPVRVLIAPPGLDEDQRNRLREVESATIRVVGTKVSGGIYEVSGDDLQGWQAEFVTGDVTSQILTLLAGLRDQEPPEEVDRVDWRVPTEAELAAVAADLRTDRLHTAPGATLDALPSNADAGALFAAFPQQPPGEPVPRYGPALAGLFPDTAVFVMYGNWVEYHGPLAGEFTDVAGASFYAQFADRLSRYAYPQGNVAHAYLERVTDVRYSGLFERPLPYRPFDPLRVALPALPWLFAGCVLGFLLLSVRPMLGATARPRRPPARLAGLTTLAIELSALSGHAALVRAIGRLQAAREAFDADLPDRQVRRLLAQAQRELDLVARKLGRPDYRPDVYLAGGIS